MQGHEKDAVVVLLDVVDIGDQGNVLQESGEGCLCVLFLHALFIVGDLADKLFHVALAVLSVLFPGCAQGIDVAGAVQNVTGQFHEGVGEGVVPVLKDHVRKGTEL